MPGHFMVLCMKHLPTDALSAISKRPQSEKIVLRVTISNYEIKKTRRTILQKKPYIVKFTIRRKIEVC